MSCNAKPIIFERAKAMRENMTQAEKSVWEKLKSNKMLGLKFKAQHPIDIFIADFYCHMARLVIEMDGGYHDYHEQKLLDQWRTKELEDLGLKVIRFRNEEIDLNLEKVLDCIKTVILERTKNPSP